MSHSLILLRSKVYEIESNAQENKPKKCVILYNFLIPTHFEWSVIDFHYFPQLFAIYHLHESDIYIYIYIDSYIYIYLHIQYTSIRTFNQPCFLFSSSPRVLCVNVRTQAQAVFRKKLHDTVIFLEIWNLRIS